MLAVSWVTSRVVDISPLLCGDVVCGSPTPASRASGARGDFGSIVITIGRAGGVASDDLVLLKDCT
jgi:hypothetical protein